MKYFTREWHADDLPEDEREAVLSNYRQHVQRLVEGAPQAVVELARENIHDGRIRSASWNPEAKSLELSLRCGDPQSVHFDLDLAYAGVEMSSRDAANLRSRQRDPRTEILNDEVDVEKDGARYIHRILFWPRDEVEIRFTELKLEKSVRPHASTP